MNKHSIAPKLKKRRHHWNQGLLKGDARLLKTFPFRISASTSSKLRPSICPAVTLMNTSKVTTLGRYPKAKSKQFTFVCLELVNLMGKVVKREKYNAFLKKAQQNQEILSLRLRLLSFKLKTASLYVSQPKDQQEQLWQLEIPQMWCDIISIVFVQVCQHTLNQFTQLTTRK